VRIHNEIRQRDLLAVMTKGQTATVVKSTRERGYSDLAAADRKQEHGLGDGRWGHRRHGDLLFFQSRRERWVEDNRRAPADHR
jgi:hypothetical protein